MDEEKKQINTGLILVEPKPEDYIFGGVSPIGHTVIFPDGHGLENYLPQAYMQEQRGLEPMNCVTNSAQNVIMAELDLFYGVKRFFSRRFTAKMSGTTPNGNDLQSVAESIRKDGLVDEPVWPFLSSITTWAEYYCPILNSVINKALSFKNTEYLINHEWVAINPDNIINSLKYGKPVQATVYAWQKGDDGLYHDFGNNPNHGIYIFDYVQGVKWRIFDTYNWQYDENDTNKQDFIKELAWDYKFGQWGKVFTVTKIFKPQESWTTVLSNFIINILKKTTNMALKFFMRDKNTGKFYFVKDNKKQEITTVNGILTILDTNFGAKQTDWGELSQYPDNKFFN